MSLNTLKVTINSNGSKKWTYFKLKHKMCRLLGSINHTTLPSSLCSYRLTDWVIQDLDEPDDESNLKVTPV